MVVFELVKRPNGSFDSKIIYIGEGKNYELKSAFYMTGEIYGSSGRDIGTVSQPFGYTNMSPTNSNLIDCINWDASRAAREFLTESGVSVDGCKVTVTCITRLI